ncbi:unnamed protein product [Protopolystoma xenopodis]|uniref:Uncharacterized protein n=1 Tax=Protopolystoma xenopodis TaxID=117903 RepID=A0A3S5CF29_9PLAT|nr:unnamed protein product [Protopolystoma xenopodis]
MKRHKACIKRCLKTAEFGFTGKTFLLVGFRRDRLSSFALSLRLLPSLRATESRCPGLSVGLRRNESPQKTTLALSTFLFPSCRSPPPDRSEMKKSVPSKTPHLNWTPIWREAEPQLPTQHSRPHRSPKLSYKVMVESSQTIR